MVRHPLPAGAAMMRTDSGVRMPEVSLEWLLNLAFNLTIAAREEYLTAQSDVTGAIEGLRGYNEIAHQVMARALNLYTEMRRCAIRSSCLCICRRPLPDSPVPAAPALWWPNPCSSSTS